MVTCAFNPKYFETEEGQPWAWGQPKQYVESLPKKKKKKQAQKEIRVWGDSSVDVFALPYEVINLIPQICVQS